MVMLFARLARAARNQRFQRWLKAATGVVFIGFGAKMATLQAG
jgi:threonine/homoserine/homoserine lactone efflux protein